ncbi:MAG: hypothetical protein ACTSV2_18225 [Candidatus Thorarchaeota archaeon]
MKEEKTKLYDKRHLAKTDSPLSSKHRTRKCIACGSKNTIILHDADSNSTTSDGWFWRDRTREFKCLDCGKYYEIHTSETYRKSYIRGS